MSQHVTTFWTIAKKCCDISIFFASLIIIFFAYNAIQPILMVLVDNYRFENTTNSFFELKNRLIVEKNVKNTQFSECAS